MMNVLTFNHIKNADIFEAEFNDLKTTGNASIEFKMQKNKSGGIAVLYAPNGTGKTSLCNVLANESVSAEIDFSCEYNDCPICGSDKKFHVIRDQISRNIIPGDTSDYLIGADIRREYKLKDKIENGFKDAFSEIVRVFKDKYQVTKVGDFLLNKIEDNEAVKYLKKILPAKTRGRNIEQPEFISYIKNTALYESNEILDDDKLKFVIDDCASNKLIEKILSINLSSFVSNEEIYTIEKNDDAIQLLNKYHDSDSCIVCDNLEYNSEELIQRKEENRKRVYESLDPKTKKLIEDVKSFSMTSATDPFCIKNVIIEFIYSGDVDTINKLTEDINMYIRAITHRMTNILLCCFNGTKMLTDYDEYLELLENQPVIDEEALMYIQEVISDNIDLEIKIERDTENDNNFKLMLGGNEFLGVDRSQMHLSNGEQNFISLAFALLLAKNSDKEFIVLDDPISSFDSIYKNKIAFCIIKFLEDKKQIILTHNTDLIRLLEVQQNGCFNLYLFNNTQGGLNGFTLINGNEKELLINLSKLIRLFQNKDNLLLNEIHNPKQFLMAMIPFMRGYAHISKNGDTVYSTLSKVMHGYESASANITELYESLFGFHFSTTYIISVTDILNLDCTNIDFMKRDNYPLLAESLRQTLIYYHLRMKVEKELVDIFDINTKSGLMLNQIINKAFICNSLDPDASRMLLHKVFFTSRKTLLNEFNHFEGNMNIFQPAIDITPSALQREITAIQNKLNELHTEYDENNTTTLVCSVII